MNNFNLLMSASMENIYFSFFIRNFDNQRHIIRQSRFFCMNEAQSAE